MRWFLRSAKIPTEVCRLRWTAQECIAMTIKPIMLAMRSFSLSVLLLAWGISENIICVKVHSHSSLDSIDCGPYPLINALSAAAKECLLHFLYNIASNLSPSWARQRARRLGVFPTSPHPRLSWYFTHPGGKNQGQNWVVQSSQESKFQNAFKP